MMSKGSYLFKQVMQFIGYMVLQLIGVQSLIALPYVRCFIYVSVLLLLFRLRTHMPLQMLFAFGLGLLMDAFYETLGIHASASVLLVYVKGFLSKIMLPASSSSAVKPGLTSLGFANFSIFILVSLFIHHGAVFCLEACNSGLFLLAMRKAFLSTLVTYLVIISIQVFFNLVANDRLS